MINKNIFNIFCNAPYESDVITPIISYICYNEIFYNFYNAATFVASCAIPISILPFAGLYVGLNVINWVRAIDIKAVVIVNSDELNHVLINPECYPELLSKVIHENDWSNYFNNISNALYHFYTIYPTEFKFLIFLGSIAICVGV